MHSVTALSEYHLYVLYMLLNKIKQLAARPQCRFGSVILIKTVTFSGIPRSYDLL